jgi:hypothetical protein
VRTFYRLTPMPPRMAAAFLIMWSPSIDGADRAPSSKDNAATVEVEPAGALRTWIDALAVAESGNRNWIVHEEEDGRLYYGCLQFREETFRYFVKKFRLVQTAQPGDVMSLIYDCAFQKRLAARMIRENPSNWKHWRKTVERIGLPPGAKGPVDAAAIDQPGRAMN